MLDVNALKATDPTVLSQSAMADATAALLGYLAAQSEQLLLRQTACSAGVVEPQAKEACGSLVSGAM